MGVFKGANRIDLMPRTPKRPVVLVGGLNGTGKTTILDAVRFALFGLRAKSIDRLADWVHRDCDDDTQAIVSLTIQRHVDGESHEFVVSRNWSRARPDPTLVVQRQGETDAFLTEHWAEQVQSFFPLEVARLFMFDGEQIRNLADPARTREILRSAIQNLLGLDLVEQLRRDLGLVRRRVAQENQTADGTSLRELESVCLEAVRELDSARQELGCVQGRLDRAENKLAEAQEQFEARGGPVAQERGLMEQQLEGHRQNIRGLEDELRQLIAGAWPYTLVHDQLTRMHNEWRQEREAAFNAKLARSAAARDRRLVKSLQAKLSPKSLEAVKAELKATRPKQTRAKKARLPDSEEFGRELEILIHHEIPDAKAGAEALAEQLRNERAESERIERALDAAPDIEGLAELTAELATRREAVESARRELDKARAGVEALERRQSEAESRLRKTWETRIKSLSQDHRSRRIAETLPQVEEVLQELQARLVNRRLDSLNGLILDCSRKLLRKESLIHAVRIDPASLELSLEGADGGVLRIDDLSAGERQLLATAILWALARASGRPLPTLIDTPLGRLDTTHRHRLAESYFPRASHQIILLSTNEEVVGEVFERLRPFVSHTWLLRHDDQTGVTRPKPGYWEEA